MTANSPRPRLVMHVDMDAFFAAIEQLDDPSLDGKPVIVGAKPGGRGVVATCNYEARRFGLHSAMPISHAAKQCPQGVYLRPRMKRYATVSKEVMAALATISPVVEPVSVDEAFVDITGLSALFGDPPAIGRRAKRAVLDRTGLTCSVGIGPNRLIAKIASDHDKPDGLTIVAADQVDSFLGPLPVSSLRGVGRVLGKKLSAAGVRTVSDLRRWEKERLARRFGATTGAMLHRQARGKGSDRVGHQGSRKSISKETTFNRDVRDEEKIRETLKAQSAKIGLMARRKGLQGRCIQIKIRLEGFETHTRSRTIREATNNDDTIFKTGWELFTKSGFASKPIRLIGIGISDWSSDNQLELFPRADRKKQDLLDTRDKIVERFGADVFGFRPKKK